MLLRVHLTLTDCSQYMYQLSASNSNLSIETVEHIDGLHMNEMPGFEMCSLCQIVFLASPGYSGLNNSLPCEPLRSFGFQTWFVSSLPWPVPLVDFYKLLIMLTVGGGGLLILTAPLLLKKDQFHL